MIIPIEDLIVEDRQRLDKKPRAIKELAEDIEKNGLYHPPVVQLLEDGRYRLLAGERRLLAIKLLNKSYRCGQDRIMPGFLPITLLSELSALQQAEIELHENILRADLDWTEREQAIAKLHELRQSQNTNHRVIDTARELATIKGETLPATKNIVSRALLISQHMSDPAVANARSAHEAHMAILRSAEAGILLKIAAKKKVHTPHTFYSGDFHDHIPSLLEALPFDVVIADPPYGIDADKFGSATTKHHYADDKPAALRLYQDIIDLAFQVTKPDSFLFLFCDIDAFHELRNMAAAADWLPWRTPLVWDKASPSGIEPIPTRGFIRNYELILYCRKGDRARGDSMSDVIRVPRISIPGHSSAKPPELYRLLMARSGNPGDRVLDPCCGVGTVFHAARSLNWIATGIELDESCAKIAEAASKGLKSQ